MSALPIMYADDVAPDLVGTMGKAWCQDIAAMAKRYPGGPPPELTLGSWIVEARYAHPLWHSYQVICIALRDVPGVPAAIIHLPGATHEIHVAALDPTKRRPLDAEPAHLTPLNFVGQFIEPSDETARARVERSVQEVIDGTLSPDTDCRRLWVARYGDSCMKRGWDIDDAIVRDPITGATVVVGTGKTNMDALGQIAAPTPEKMD